MKTKKKIKTFNNWLLARDGSSRISTFPSYFATLENSNENKDFRSVMDKFDVISNSKCFYKLNRYFSYGMSKQSKEGNMRIWVDKKSITLETSIFLECLNPDNFNPIKYIFFLTNPEIKETSIDFNQDESQIIVKFPPTIDNNALDKIAEDAINSWIDNSNFGETYKNNFFKWWMKASLFKGSKWESFPNQFKSALVEWMRVCPIEEAQQAYLELINNANDKGIRRVFTDLGTKDIIEHVDQGIKEFNINLSALQKGSRIISRWGN